MLKSMESPGNLRLAILPTDTALPHEAAAIGKGPADAVLASYLSHYLDNLTGALAATFPIVARIVGKPCFASLVEGFVMRSASRSVGIVRSGMTFPIYLASVPALAGAAYLPDVARLEWAVNEASRAQGASGLSTAALMQVRDTFFSRLIFAVNPASHTVASRYPVDSIWRAGQSSPNTPGNTRQAENAVRLLVHRPTGRDVVLRRLSKAEFTFLRALRAGRTLGEAEKHAIAVEEPFNTGRILIELIDAGVLTDFTIGSALLTGGIS